MGDDNRFIDFCVLIELDGMKVDFKNCEEATILGLIIGNSSLLLFDIPLLRSPFDP